jgi:hypothetical protein
MFETETEAIRYSVLRGAVAPQIKANLRSGRA